MTRIHYAVISAGLIFEAIRRNFRGISGEKGSRERDIYLRGLFAMNGPLVHYNGEKLDDIMDLIQMSARKDFNTPDKIKTMVLAGLGGRSVQVALYPFLSESLAIDLVVHHARFQEMNGTMNSKGGGELFHQAEAFVSENMGISKSLAAQYCGFIIEQMMSYQETIPPRARGGVIPTRVPVT